jgi:hypothetical protein
MSSQKRLRRKRYFTLSEANAMLPLLRAILRDVMELAQSLRDRQERLKRLRRDDSKSLGKTYNDELEQIEASFASDQEQMQQYEQELKDLGVELKDYFVGLIDFPCVMDNREVYLCWRFDEPDVAHWHELDAGFSGRQPILENVSRLV